jgi:phosphorylase kinase alpha/beta subunit
MGIADPAQPANRPHIRFDGQTLQELPDQQWPHAQNDALGYFVWLVSVLARQRALRLQPEEAQTMLLFVRYFQAVRFWEDADSGHWEETPKVSASSIGTVLAGLRELSALLHDAGADSALASVRTRGQAVIEDMLARGQAALDAILPAESVAPGLRRAHDAALVFLAYPLRVLTEPMAATVLGDVDRHLTGDIGIRRYAGDSYWAPEYDLKVGPAERTQDYSGGLEARDRLLEKPGDEAQWCIFDGYIAAHHGATFALTGDEDAYLRQVHHANRALRQLSAEQSELPNRCPELYYLKEGQWIPNAHTPLQWSQAALVVALEGLAASAKLLG